MGKSKYDSQLEELAGAPRDERYEVLQRAANGVCFGRTQRLRDFLLYVGTRALDGRDSEITEQLIGERVFERGPGFSPIEDNIVRSMARTLRVKLKEHFEGEGRGEGWRIEIPKGSYVPQFRAVPRAMGAGQWRGVAAAALAVVVVLGGVAGWLGWRLAELEPPRSLFSALLGDTAGLSVVCSDSLHGNYQALRGELTPLEDYASGQLFGRTPPAGSDARVEALWPLLSSELLSNQADLRMAMRLARSLPYRTKVELRHPRALRMGDFREGGDFLLLAARRSNPWVGLFEAGLNFRLVFPSASRSSEIENVAPRAGEEKVYRSRLDARGTGTAFARVALVPGLGGRGRVLLVGGTSGASTDAAAEMLLNSRSLEEVERLAGRRLTGASSRLEVLLETTSVGGYTKDTRIISVR